MKREEVFECTKNCINGKLPTCVVACPFGMDIKAFLKKIGRGKIDAALKELSAALPFPRIISDLCPAYCEDECQRKTILNEETISINLIEKSCVRLSKKEQKSQFTFPLQEIKTAVVGAGPAGLSLAYYMDKKRYRVTIFEKEIEAGGNLRKLPAFSEYKDEIEKSFRDTDVVFELGREIRDIAELKDFDLIFISTGKDGNDFGLIPETDKPFGHAGNTNIFMGGELLGYELIEGMAKTLDTSKAMEAYMQTGSTEHALIDWQDKEASKPTPHFGEAPSAHILPAEDFYSEKEAALEASRCMMCDCEECVKECELLTKYKKKPPRIAIDVVQDGMTRNSVSSACITRQTWSCNECGYCKKVCGEDVDVGEVFEMSRLDRVKSGNYPKAFHGYWLREMKFVSGETKLIKGAPEGGPLKYIFFPGCRLGANDPRYVIKSFELLSKNLKKTGIYSDCCGIPALWAGEGDFFKEHLKNINETWEALGRPAFIYACASCRRTFERFLPSIKLISLYEILSDMEYDIQIDDDLNDIIKKNFAVFDPCAATDVDELKDSVRSLAKKSGVKLTGYQSKGNCCGYGGHIQLANPGFFDELARSRSKDSNDPFLVYCTNCKEVFQNSGKECVHVLDTALGISPKGPVTLEEKKENMIFIKKEILNRYYNEDYNMEKQEYDKLNVECSDEAIGYMEKTLIPLSDVKKTIWINEKEDEGFENEDGETLCKLKGDYITCWVKYKKQDGKYQVISVYSHRMTIRED